MAVETFIFSPLAQPRGGAVKLRVVDLLIEVLRAQAETLELLRAALGQDELIHLLEEKDPPPSLFKDVTPWCSGELSSRSGMSNPYKEVEGAVREMDLSALLEFYLWAYPTYRAWVESPVLLESLVTIDPPGHLARLADLTLLDAKAYVRHLTLPPQLSKQMEKLVDPAWIKFRTRLLSQSGKKRLTSV